MSQLQKALKGYLPRVPGTRTLHQAIDAGMPWHPDPVGRKFPTFVLAEILEWWYGPKVTTKPIIASDVAIQISRRSRKTARRCPKAT
jgi:hypothetical protein